MYIKPHKGAEFSAAKNDRPGGFSGSNLESCVLLQSIVPGISSNTFFVPATHLKH